MMKYPISDKEFENHIHEMFKAKGLKISSSVVPSKWRPKDVVFEVEKRISKQMEEEFWGK